MATLLRTLLAAPLCLLTIAASAQATTPAARLAAARSSYYTPTTQGLKSFHCAVAMDWKDLLKRFGAGDLPDSDPHLQYLRTIQLSAEDDLHGAGKLNWSAPTDPPEAMKAGVEKIRGGMIQMFGGFFQSWNPFMNGTYLPAPASDLTVSANGEGLLVHGGDASLTLDEDFDKNLLLTRLHVVSSALDVTTYPAFTDTPQGRIFTSLKSEIHQPPTAPVINVTMTTTYTTVSNYQLPAALSFSVPSSGTFNFKLSACQVNP